MAPKDARSAFSHTDSFSSNLVSKETRKCFSSAADCGVSLHFRVQRPNNNFCALRWFVYNCTAPLCTTPLHSTLLLRSDPICPALLCSARWNAGGSWLAERDECETISWGTERYVRYSIITKFGVIVEQAKALRK